MTMNYKGYLFDSLRRLLSVLVSWATGGEKSIQYWCSNYGIIVHYVDHHDQLLLLEKKTLKMVYDMSCSIV